MHQGLKIGNYDRAKYMRMLPYYIKTLLRVLMIIGRYNGSKSIYYLTIMNFIIV